MEILQNTNHKHTSICLFVLHQITLKACFIDIERNYCCMMTIIVFLIDTSASMNQRTYLGVSLLDVAKGAVETFIKVMLYLILICYWRFYVEKI